MPTRYPVYINQKWHPPNIIEFYRLAEKLLEKETISLPDIVDILGPRPWPIKESVAEYLQELRERRDTVDVEIAEEDRIAQEKMKAAVDASKFDPDAEEKEEAAAEKKEDGEAASEKKEEDAAVKDESKDDKDKKD